MAFDVLLFISVRLRRGHQRGLMRPDGRQSELRSLGFDAKRLLALRTTPRTENARSHRTAPRIESILIDGRATAAVAHRQRIVLTIARRSSLGRAFAVSSDEQLDIRPTTTRRAGRARKVSRILGNDCRALCVRVRSTCCEPTDAPRAGLYRFTVAAKVARGARCSASAARARASDDAVEIVFGRRPKQFVPSPRLLYDDTSPGRISSVFGGIDSDAVSGVTMTTRAGVTTFRESDVHIDKRIVR